MSEEKQSRPGPATEATPKDFSVTLIVPDGDAFAAYADAAWVAVVQSSSGRYTKRVFVTLKAAQLAVAKAVQRGQAARVVLAELRPLYVVDGDSRQDVLGGDAG